MTHVQKPIALKIIHTLIWVFFNLVFAYLIYAVIIDAVDVRVWIGIALILGEGLVLLIFKNHCPLSFVARTYTDSTEANFDIYLPNFIAKYNKLIYTILFIAILLALIYRLS